MIPSLSVAAQPPIRVIISGQELIAEVPPMIVHGRTMVPMRAIFEALGAEVEWNAQHGYAVATMGDIFMMATIGSHTYNVNHETVRSDVAPMIVNGRTLIPARFVAEVFGYQVDWVESRREVHIYHLDEVAGYNPLDEVAQQGDTASRQNVAAQQSTPAATARSWDAVYGDHLRSLMRGPNPPWFFLLHDITQAELIPQLMIMTNAGEMRIYNYSNGNLAALTYTTDARKTPGTITYYIPGAMLPGIIRAGIADGGNVLLVTRYDLDRGGSLFVCDTSRVYLAAIDIDDPNYAGYSPMESFWMGNEEVSGDLWWSNFGGDNFTMIGHELTEANIRREINNRLESIRYWTGGHRD